MKDWLVDLKLTHEAAKAINQQDIPILPENIFSYIIERFKELIIFNPLIEKPAIRFFVDPETGFPCFHSYWFKNHENLIPGNEKPILFGFTPFEISMFNPIELPEDNLKGIEAILSTGYTYFIDLNRNDFEQSWIIELKEKHDEATIKYKKDVNNCISEIKLCLIKTHEANPLNTKPTITFFNDFQSGYIFFEGYDESGKYFITNTYCNNSESFVKSLDPELLAKEGINTDGKGKFWIYL